MPEEHAHLARDCAARDLLAAARARAFVERAYRSARPDGGVGGWDCGARARAGGLAVARAPDHFPEGHTRRAYKVPPHKALADLIAMVKLAKSETWPLLSAEERVDIAITRVLDGSTLTEPQKGWVEHIRQHLVANLSIDHDDFDNVPVLSNRGGWGRANKVFDGKLGDLVARLNREVVAA